MNFKLRILPLMLSIAVSFIILFGGWFAYHSMAVKQPFSQIVSNIVGVEYANVEINRGEVNIELLLQYDASLREIVLQINEQGRSYVDDKQLIIDIINSPSSELDRWWSSALFDVAEAMEKRQYSKIPLTLNNLGSNTSNLQVMTEMDSTHVYVRLIQGDHAKFIMLPIHPPPIGVWNHD